MCDTPAPPPDDSFPAQVESLLAVRCLTLDQFYVCLDAVLRPFKDPPGAQSCPGGVRSAFAVSMTVKSTKF